jgi:hypothetical protein
VAVLRQHRAGRSQRAGRAERVRPAARLMPESSSAPPVSTTALWPLRVDAEVDTRSATLCPGVRMDYQVARLNRMRRWLPGLAPAGRGGREAS